MFFSAAERVVLEVDGVGAVEESAIGGEARLPPCVAASLPNEALPDVALSSKRGEEGGGDQLSASDTAISRSCVRCDEQLFGRRGERSCIVSKHVMFSWRGRRRGSGGWGGGGGDGDGVEFVARESGTPDEANKAHIYRACGPCYAVVTHLNLPAVGRCKQLRQSDAVFFSLDCRGVQGRREAIKIDSAFFPVQSVLATDAIAGRRVKRLITSAGSEERK